MNRRKFGLLGLSKLAVLAVMGCSGRENQASIAPQVPAMSAAQKYELAASAHGFAVGSLMSANTAYVFFDPLCTHCGVLWRNAKSFAHKARIVWIPIGLLSSTSRQLGAGILAAENPIAILDKLETRTRRGHERGSAQSELHPDEQDLVRENTEIFKKMGAQGVPLLVYRNAATGVFSVSTGEVSAEQLTIQFGL